MKWAVRAGGCAYFGAFHLPTRCSRRLPLQAAVDMMRKVLNGVRMDGVVVIGEGEKDEVRGRGKVLKIHQC